MRYEFWCISPPCSAKPQREMTNFKALWRTVNFSISLSTRTPFPPVLLLDSSATLYKVNELEQYRSSTSNAILYFQAMFSLALPLWFLKVPNVSSIVIVPDIVNMILYY